MSFEPVSAGIPERPFASRYGYSIELGDYAIPTPSDRACDPGIGWLSDADLFEFWHDTWLRIASMEIPARMTENQWLAEFLPAGASGARAQWSPGMVGGYPFAYRKCDPADGYAAYAIVGRRVYAFGGRGDPASFFDFLATIEFRAEDAAPAVP